MLDTSGGMKSVNEKLISFFTVRADNFGDKTTTFI